MALFAGLGLWLFLMLRGLWPALRRRDESRPLVAMFAGDFSGITPKVYDPTSGTNGANKTQFPGNIIPTSRISPITQKVMDRTPLPNLNAGVDPAAARRMREAARHDDLLGSVVTHAAVRWPL